MESKRRPLNELPRSVAVLAGISLIWFSGVSNDSAHAQQPKLETVELEGTLDAVAGERLKLKAEDGTDYFIVLTPKTMLKYAGTADAKFLRPGLMVRFDATFDTQKGIAIKPVSEIEVFRPTRARRMSAEQRQSQTAGVYPVTEKDGNAQNARIPNRNTRVNQSVATGTKLFRVVGQLQVIQATKIRVGAGSRPIIVDLDPGVKVSVAAGDIVFCQPGDKVKVTGLRNAGQAAMVQAGEVEIAGAKPLGAGNGNSAKGSAARGSQTRSTRTRGKLGEK